MKYITSIQNLSIKNVIALQEKSRLRKESGCFVIDGWKETLMAIENGFEIETVFILTDSLDEATLSQLKQKLLPTADVVHVSVEVMDKIAYRGANSKAVSIAKLKQNVLSALTPKQNALYIILDKVEKPGNLGAILRIADAAGVDAVLCADLQTDVFNPNVIRSSVGCMFTQKIVIAEKEEIVTFLRNNEVHIFTTSLKAAINYLHADYTQSCAFVFGTEADGVQPFWEEQSTQNILIPMRGQNDSLNVSNSVAIVVFEALRQRMK